MDHVVGRRLKKFISFIMMRKGDARVEQLNSNPETLDAWQYKQQASSPKTHTEMENLATLRLSLLNNASPRRSLDRPFYSDCKDNEGRIQIAYVDNEMIGHQVIKAILWEDAYSLVFFHEYQEFESYMETCNMLPDAAFVNVDNSTYNSFVPMCKRIRLKMGMNMFPILAITTLVCERMVTRFLTCDVNDYMLKPLRKIEVLRRLRTHIIVKNDVRIKEDARKNYEILSDVFPDHIIDKMKINQKKSLDKQVKRQVIAETHDCITVLFSDVVQFTQLAAQSPIISIVYMLNEMFSTFDDLCELYNVYKVETIGDAYMVVSGQDQRQNDHATRVVHMGFAMLEGMKHILLDGKNMEIRIGINSGPAYSGVIGKKRARYCFFGDTINTANRMESSGSPSRIHISESTYFLIKDDPSFFFEKLGPKEIKGKGIMNTYFVYKRPSNDKTIGIWYNAATMV